MGLKQQIQSFDYLTQVALQFTNFLSLAHMCSRKIKCKEHLVGYL
jgi:hypothetical protein